MKLQIHQIIDDFFCNLDTYSQIPTMKQKEGLQIFHCSQDFCQGIKMHKMICYNLTEYCTTSSSCPGFIPDSINSAPTFSWCWAMRAHPGPSWPFSLSIHPWLIAEHWQCWLPKQPDLVIILSSPWKNKYSRNSFSKHWHLSSPILLPVLDHASVKRTSNGFEVGYVSQERQSLACRGWSVVRADSVRAF